MKPKPSTQAKPSASLPTLNSNPNLGTRRSPRDHAQHISSKGLEAIANGTKIKSAQTEKEVSSGSIELKEAMKSPDWPYYEKAIKEELDKQQKAGTWKVIPKSQANPKLTVTSRWVLTWKLMADGLKKFKARLVAKGFQQQSGSYDPLSLYAPTVASSSVRIMFAACAALGWIVEHLDFQTAFLNADLEEEIYMTLPKDSDFPLDQVLQLIKSIYGLKQSSANWYLLLRATLVKLGYKPLIQDICVYKHATTGVMMSTHVDDIQIVSPSASLCKELKEEIEKLFKISDLGEIKKYVGVNVKITDKSILLHQQNQIEELAQTLQIENVKSPTSPGPSNSQQCLSTKPVDNTKYRSLVGSLMYIATHTRPDISAPLMLLSRKCQSPTEGDYNNLVQIAKYLYGTKDKGPLYSKSDTLREKKETSIPLFAYSDATFASIDQTYSVSGGVIMLNDGPIFWSSHKQDTIPQSSTEAECIAVYSIVRELMTLTHLLDEMEINYPTPIPVYTDSQSLIAATLSLADASKSKLRYIRTKVQWLKELVVEKKINLIWKKGTDNPADALTKPLYGEQYTKLSRALFHQDNSVHSPTID
jgi:hypothetical protein